MNSNHPMNDTSKKGLLIVTSGPSGSGKTTLCRMVEAQLNIPHNVSYTTRAARVGEQDGKDYYFVTNETFDQMIQDSKFAEWANVHGRRYGTAKSDIEEKISNGQDIILDLDTQGALNIKQLYPESFLVFIDVHDDILKQRLGSRGTESEEHIQKRLAQVQNERSMSAKYDYVLHNHDLKLAFQELVDYILKQRSA